MAGDKGTKINHLLKAWPPGTVAATSWLETQGIYHQLAADYERSAWIKRIGHGAFIRDGDQVNWEGALYAIQTQLKLSVFAAAKTALELQGIVHFVPMGPGRAVYLFGAPRTKLPSWFKQHDWQVKIHFKAAHLFSGPPDLGLTEKREGSFSIRLSSRERAILEVLHLIPHDQGFEEASLLFESLRTLRPALVQELLENCRSIKAKRLFLHFSESSNQPWFKDLDPSKIMIGSGKRRVAEGGVFDSKYGISVPKISKGENGEGVEGA